RDNPNPPPRPHRPTNYEAASIATTDFHDLFVAVIRATRVQIAERATLTGATLVEWAGWRGVGPAQLEPTGEHDATLGVLLWLRISDRDAERQGKGGGGGIPSRPCGQCPVSNSADRRRSWRSVAGRRPRRRNPAAGLPSAAGSRA